MADTTAFDALTAKLPSDHQRCFVAMSAQVRKLPPDDDLALALEVLGFAALALKEVPGEVSEAVERIHLGRSDKPHEEIRDALAHWLDESCYNRLRETLRLVKQHHFDSRCPTERASKSLLGMWSWLAGRSARQRRTVFGVCGAVACGATLLVVSDLARPDNQLPTPVLTRIHEAGLIGYHEAEIPELGGKVGMVLVDGEVLGAFTEGGRGVVVVKPISKP